MSSIRERTQRDIYIEKAGWYPVSRAISEVEKSFDGEMRLFSKSGTLTSPEETPSRPVPYVIGNALGYRDARHQDLFVFLALQHEVAYNGLYEEEYNYPSGFFVATDRDGEKLHDYLETINEGSFCYHHGLLGIFDGHNRNGVRMLTGLESHKRSKKGLYLRASSVQIGSSLTDLKRILDR